MSWDAVDTLGGHRTHLDLLCDTVLGLVKEIARRIAAIDATQEIGAVYDDCRHEDVRLLHARRLWRWYADKLDQRLAPPEDIGMRTLLAADEVVWSCWKTAFTALSATVPAAPLPYLSPLYSATATPRTDPPPDLRPGQDDLLKKLVECLPIAAIGFPPVSCRRPWWLILGAHEASHHVQFECDGLEALTRERVVAGAFRAVKDVELSEMWEPWCRELFADACSVLLVGPAAIWAVSELETRTEPGMRKSPSGSYPPPLVRLAVLRAVADKAAIPVPEQAVAGLRDPDPGAGDELRQLLDAVPDVADALLGLEPAPGRALKSLADPTADAYALDGSVPAWRSELLGADKPLPQERLDAARFCVAAGVDAWQRFGGQDGVAERLAVRLRDLLPRCREPGKRAAGLARDAGQITQQLVDELYPGPSGRLE